MSPGPGAVLVTGATRGIGLKTALALSTRGFEVWAGYRKREDAEAIAEASRARSLDVRAVRIDVTDPASVDAAVTRVAAHGRMHGLVNNAAVMLRGYFEDLSEAEIRRTIEVNLFGVMNVTRAALPHMRARGGGRIVMISSIGGRIGSMGLTAYVAGKFALEGFSESLALEVRPLGIHVAIVEPGIVDTAMWREARLLGEQSTDPSGPYYEWFRRAEREADSLVRSSRLTPADVAATVAEAMTAARPRLRYPVGRRASIVMSLRRFLPDDLFDRIYFGAVIRRVTGGAGR